MAEIKLDVNKIKNNLIVDNKNEGIVNPLNKGLHTINIDNQTYVNTKNIKDLINEFNRLENNLKEYTKIVDKNSSLNQNKIYNETKEMLDDVLYDLNKTTKNKNKEVMEYEKIEKIHNNFVNKMELALLSKSPEDRLDHNYYLLEKFLKQAKESVNKLEPIGTNRLTITIAKELNRVTKETDLLEDYIEAMNDCVDIIKDVSKENDNLLLMTKEVNETMDLFNKKFDLEQKQELTLKDNENINRDM